MGGDHQFDRVGDQLPADHGHLHARVAGGDAVANRDGRKLQGSSPGFGDPQFNRLRDGVQMDMPGHEFVERIHHRHQRLFQMSGIPPHGIKKGTVGGPVKALGNRRTSKYSSTLMVRGQARPPLIYPAQVSPSFTIETILRLQPRERSPMGFGRGHFLSPRSQKTQFAGYRPSGSLYLFFKPGKIFAVKRCAGPEILIAATTRPL